jgi:hypothetical protein
MQQQQVEAAAGDAARLQALRETFATDVAKTREKTERDQEKVRNAGEPGNRADLRAEMQNRER